MNPSIVKRCLVGAVLAIAATLPGFQQLHTSVEGLKLIADYEGCRLQPYQCSAGVWTDGIGNTSGVIPGKTITERQAAEGLISNVLRVERALERCVKQQPPQKVYDATVSFAFNVGTGNACSSTLVKLLNQRRWADACRQLPRWVYVKGVFNQGLDTREPAKKESTTVKRKRRTKKQKKEPEAKQGDYLVGTDENVLVLNRTYANRSNAERAAKMQWERLQRGVASFSLQLAEGRADLYTEMPVKVSGFKQPIDDAEWTITTLTHTVSPDNGFTTSLELEVRIDDFEME
ncbi:glycoside hydrolase family protein [Escherichia coli]|uniref:glycoside hydrolase family protein n=3 Tax=Escherichia coli TaxID=562 RepID=UPI00372D16A0